MHHSKSKAFPMFIIFCISDVYSLFIMLQMAEMVPNPRICIQLLFFFQPYDIQHRIIKLHIHEISVEVIFIVKEKLNKT